MVVTGVEYAFLIGKVDATVECIKVCIEATDYIIDFTNRARKIPQVITDLSAVLAVASMTLNDMSKKYRRLRCSPEQCRGLQLLIKLTGQTASHTEAILKSVTPKLHSRWFHRSSKALKALYKDKTIKKHMDRLMQHLQLLSVSVILKTPTSDEIADAVFRRTHHTVGVNVLGQIETLSSGTPTRPDPTVTGTSS